MELILIKIHFDILFIIRINHLSLIHLWRIDDCLCSQSILLRSSIDRPELLIILSLATPTISFVSSNSDSVIALKMSIGILKDFEVILKKDK